MGGFTFYLPNYPGLPVIFMNALILFGFAMCHVLFSIIVQYSCFAMLFAPLLGLRSL